MNGNININTSTGYYEVTVVRPGVYREDLAEKFPVLEDKEDELVLLGKEQSSNTPFPSNDVREYIDNIDIDPLISSSGIKWQKDLPEKYRDEEKYETEKYLMEPQTGEISVEEGEAILKCLNYIDESDSDHQHIINSCMERVKEIVDGNINEINEKPDKDEVLLSLKVLEREGVYRTLGGDHKNTSLIEGRSFIEMNSEHGSLPSVKGDYMNIR